MRLRIPVLVLLFASLGTNAHAVSSTSISGFECLAQGLADVSTSPDGKHMFVNNFKLDFTSGCDITLSGLDGHQIQCASSWSSSNAGAECRYSWGVTNSNPTGSGLHARTALTRTPDGVTFTCDLSEMTSSPSVTCLLYRQGVLITSIQFPKLTTVELLSPPAAPTLVPSVAFELDHATHRCLSSVEFASPVLFEGGGQGLQVDRVVLVAGDLTTDGKLDLCSMRCRCDPGFTFTSLDCSSMSGVALHTCFTVSGVDWVQQSSLMHLQSNPLYGSGAMSGENPLFERLYGHGGGGGGGSVALSHIDLSSSARALAMSSSSPFVLDPAQDEGASLECRVMGSGGNSPTCSLDGVLASVRTHVEHQKLWVASNFRGMCADQESVIVMSHGASVARLSVSVALDGSSTVAVSAPPGGSPLMPVMQQGKSTPVTRSNISNNLVAPGDESHSGLAGTASSSASSVVGPSGMDMQVAFLTQRVFCVDGTCATGDQIIFHGQCSDGSCSTITITGNNFSLERSLTGSGGSSLDIAGCPQSSVDQVFALVPPSLAITSSTPVVQVPVMIERVDTTPARGTSVTFSLHGLSLACPVAEGDYLSRSGQTQMFVVSNPDGSFTVDTALLGPGCGPSSDGKLFTLCLQRAPGVPDGVGSVSIDAVEVADCTAGSIPSSAGGEAFIVLDNTPPPPVTLSVSQVTSGNDRDGTIKLALSWTATDPFATVDVYAAPFGNYPDYDDGASPGSMPPALTLPPSPRWSPISMSCSSGSTGVSQCTVEPLSRDSYSFTIQVKDAYGNARLSNGTDLIPNYFLGDGSDGLAVCSGDNFVTTPDVSALAAHYGQSLSVGSPYECLDIGPTRDGTVHGQPLTDHKLGFIDLILLSISYSLVSMPASAPAPVATLDELRLRVPAVPGVGQTFDVAIEMSGAGDALGVSTQLAYDPAIVEPVAVSQGELFGRQGRDGVVLSSGPGNVDVALLGLGAGLAGEGDLARVTFRVKAAGDPGLGIANAEARDAQNRVLALAGGVGVPNATPAHTALRMAFPNPFNRSTTVVFALHQSGPASVRVFDVTGRTVRTLVNGVQPAGERVLAWDGRDDAGGQLSAGVYMLRLEAGGHSETRALRLVK